MADSAYVKFVERQVKALSALPDITQSQAQQFQITLRPALPRAKMLEVRMLLAIIASRLGVVAFAQGQKRDLAFIGHEPCIDVFKLCYNRLNTYIQITRKSVPAASLRSQDRTVCALAFVVLFDMDFGNTERLNAFRVARPEVVVSAQIIADNVLKNHALMPVPTSCFASTFYKDFPRSCNPEAYAAVRSMLAE